MDKEKKHKNIYWALPQLIPIFLNPLSSLGVKMEYFVSHNDIEEIIHDLSNLFYEMDMVQGCEGKIYANVQLMDSCVEINN